MINGGTQSIDSPRPYSAVAAGLLTALGIDPAALAERHTEREFYRMLGLGPGVFFDKETFGEDLLVKGRISATGFLEQAPLSEAARRDVRRLETEPIDYLPGLSSPEKKARLSRISYRDYLLDLVKVNPSVIPLYQSRTHGEWGVGIDAVSALDVWPFGLPGFQGLKLEPGSAPRMGYTAAGYADGGSDTFHFPDGNASIARLLVRNLIPQRYPAERSKTLSPRASTTAGSTGRRMRSACGSEPSPSPSAVADRPQSKSSIRGWTDFTPSGPGIACSPAGT